MIATLESTIGWAKDLYVRNAVTNKQPRTFSLMTAISYYLVNVPLRPKSAKVKTWPSSELLAFLSCRCFL